MIENAPTIDGGRQELINANKGERTAVHAAVTKRRGRPTGQQVKAPFPGGKPMLFPDGGDGAVGLRWKAWRWSELHNARGGG